MMHWPSLYDAVCHLCRTVHHCASIILAVDPLDLKHIGMQSNENSILILKFILDILQA